jgi:precorrin-6B methylase 2
MTPVFERSVLFLLKKLDLLSLVSLKRTGPLTEDGWFRSFRENACVDADGKPLPWMAYPAIEFLKGRIRRDMSVFEFGCGEGTLWWADRVREVVSVEHDKDWYERIAAKAPPNAELFHVVLEYEGAYSRKIADYTDRFDVVVIDGRDRVNCAKNCVGALRSDGVVIWDNSDREEYEAGYAHLYDHGFRKIGFTGFCPIVNLKTETGVFYRDANCLSI